MRIYEKMPFQMERVQKLTKLAKGFESAIRLRAGAEGNWVNAKSPNGVMKMKARSGAVLEFQADGPDAAEAVSALVGLVERNFDD